MFEHIVVPELANSNTSVLVEAFREAMSASSPAAGTQALMASLGQLFKAKRAYIYELPPEGTEFVCTCEWCAPGVEPMADVTHGLTMNMASRWFSDGEERSLLAIRDLEQFAKVSPEYAALFLPRAMKTQILGKLMRGNRPMGTLGFDDSDPQMFDMICELMYPICAFATSTVNTRNLLGRMRSVGVVDKLTGAGTRMAFYQNAERLPADIPVGMAYLDIAGLQGINDVRGHAAGDELLVAIRQILISEFHDDQVFRMGGDEFLVVVSGTEEQPFWDAMARIKMRLSDLSTYVAVGIGWQNKLGNEYDALVRHVWLECTNAKREWERRGGKRLGSDSDDLDFVRVGKSGVAMGDGMGHLDLPCYRNDEFFRRANIWSNHVETDRICMIAFDINYFKLYNDMFGRDAGDALLENYANGVAKIAGQRHGVAGYLGGDNFAIVLPVHEGSEEQAIRQLVEFELGKYDVAEGFAPSAGIVVTSDLEVGMTILYDRALVAMQEVKGSYTNHIAFYDEGRYERERQNQLLLIQAQEALTRSEFTFFLQPKVDIITNKVVSAEALVRWFHNGEIVPPYKFVGLMERSGYIFALDRYVWESVCAWQRSLIDRGISPVPVSVNVSRVDFYFTDLADHFNALVKRYDLPPRLVGVEVTESAYSKDAELITDVIHRMQESGFLVFMDDFGSGYSSLNMLRSVAVDVLKMDKGFIDNADIRNGSDAIIENVIKMAHMMGLPVISEGVETEEQRDSLRSMDCDYVQGYYYYKPMPKEEFEKLLQDTGVIELHHTDNMILALNSNVDHDDENARAVS
ncbi:MAG: EAL domain-containing protein [Atopobiaceae bacterium]|nr:EAL domain-containing protein [Atopobiaceae bacterium]